MKLDLYLPVTLIDSETAVSHGEGMMGGKQGILFCNILQTPDALKPITRT